MKLETLEEKLAALEALLFIHGEPMSVRKIGDVLHVTPEEALGLLTEFEKRLTSSGRGISLIREGDKVQLVTKSRFSGILESFVKNELAEELTPASLEALAIILYFGPISRSRIDYQRGVNSSFILRSLLLRGLVERSLDPDNSNAYLYQPSFELLRHLGVGRKEELPEYEKFAELLKRFETAEGSSGNGSGLTSAEPAPTGT